MLGGTALQTDVGADSASGSAYPHAHAHPRSIHPSFWEDAPIRSPAAPSCDRRLSDITHPFVRVGFSVSRPGITHQAVVVTATIHPTHPHEFTPFPPFPRPGGGDEWGGEGHIFLSIGTLWLLMSSCAIRWQCGAWMRRLLFPLLPYTCSAHRSDKGK